MLISAFKLSPSALKEDKARAMPYQRKESARGVHGCECVGIVEKNNRLAYKMGHINRSN